MDVGRVFSISFAMFKQRFWLLLGMVLVFFAIQLAASTVIGIAVVAVGVAGVTGLGGGVDDPSAIAGMGIGMIVMLVIFYGAYLVLLLAQQAAMVTVASPLEDPSFGAALTRGFKSALPFFAIAVLLVLGYLALTLLLGLAVAATGAAGGAMGIVLGIAFLPLLIFFACRFSVLIPVVAVDQVFNPVKAIRRSWSVTRGKVLSILLAMVGFIVLTLVAFGVPFGLFYGAVFAGQDFPALGAGVILLVFLVFVPLFIGYTMYASAFTAALHSEVSGGGAERLEEVFA